MQCSCKNALRIAILLSGVLAAYPQEAPSPSPSSTCPARSVNYITQTLLQQCFKTGWKDDNITKTVPQGVSANLDHSSSHPPVLSLTASNSAHAISVTSSEKEAQSRPADSRTADDIVSSTLQLRATESSASSTQTDPQVSGGTDQDPDADSLLDNSNFLSFEQWKVQNLAKAGQSAENVGNARARSHDSESRRRPGGMANVLDSLGEDTEIELDFGGFVSPDPGGVPASQKPATPESEGRLGETSGNGYPGARSRSKDAGKTCKERFNYASFDCGATVLKTNPESKGSTSVLVENKDSYMLNECSANNKFFIVELCNDILIDTVVLANFEFFSSIVRTFRVSVSDQYPVKMEKWRDLGTFESRNSRDVQAFLIENPLIWARYLRIEFLTHYGNEYYCPISLLRVHGTTMMEDFRHDVKAARGEDETDDQISDAENRPTDDQPTEVVVADTLKDEAEVVTTSVIPEPRSSTTTSTSTSEAPTADTEPSIGRTDILLHAADEPLTGFTFMSQLQEQTELLSSSCALSISKCSVEYLELHSDQHVLVGPDDNTLKSTRQDTLSSTGESLAPVQTPTTLHPSDNVTASQSPSTVSNSDSSHLTSTIKLDSSTTASPSRSSNDQPSQPGSKTSSQAPNPTTQESFFKSIHKRLQLLESNSTLSLQYVEDQYRILRDAFARVEKRQLAKTSSFLDALNTTVFHELHDFRTQYDQIWQSTVLELANQREQSQREALALSSRIGLLADEILFQKRVAVLQFVLILFCLILVLFSRSTYSPTTAASYLELPPLVQSMVNKSSANLSTLSRYAQFDSPSPPGSPASTRPTSRYGIFSRATTLPRSSASPDDSARADPADLKSEPSPPPSEQSDDHPVQVMTPPRSESPEADVTVRQAQSGPPTPSGRRAVVENRDHMVRLGERAVGV